MYSQRVIAVVALIAFVAMITRGGEFAWAVVVLGVIGGGAWLLARRSLGRGGGLGGLGSGYLCDTCKYSYGDVCTRPEKPNATKCPDYKPSG